MAAAKIAGGIASGVATGATVMIGLARDVIPAPGLDSALSVLQAVAGAFKEWLAGHAQLPQDVKALQDEASRIVDLIIAIPTAYLPESCASKCRVTF